MSAVLNPAREARLKLAFADAWDTRHGDPDEHRRAIERFVDAHERIWAEQLAEFGYVPTTAAGCVAVLNVAARILELIGDADAVA